MAWIKIGVMTVLRSVIAAMLMMALSQTGMMARADAPDSAFAPRLFGYFNTELAQQDVSGAATPRLLAPPAFGRGSDWQAAKAAQGCAPGGTVLRVDPSSVGYDVRVLVGSQVVVVRVDTSGNCR